MPVDPRAELREEVRQVLDLTSRIDERVKGIVDRQSELYAALNSQVEKVSSLVARVTVLESHEIQEMISQLENLSRKLTLIEIVGTDPQKRMADLVSAMSESLLKIEHRLTGLEGTASDWSGRVRAGVGEVLKAAVTIVIAYLLFRWGIKT